MKWEYMVAEYSRKTYDPLEVNADLDTFGDDGWELVSVHGDRIVRVYFKRPVPDNPHGGK